MQREAEARPTAAKCSKARAWIAYLLLPHTRAGGV